MKRSKKKVWVAGASGQLGTAILHIAQQEYPDIEVIATARGDLDYADSEAVGDFLFQHRPTAMVNCIAYTDVDEAETDFDTAKDANATIPSMLAYALDIESIPMIHIGTDHIFGGNASTRTQPYDEACTPCPANAYAQSKYLGEYGMTLFGPPYYILRTSWLYSPESWGFKSFYRSVLKWARESNTLRVVTDEVSAPTSAFTLARVILSIVMRYGSDKALPTGVYHVTDKGQASRYDLAKEIMLLDPTTSGIEITECVQSDFSLPAHRPQYSKLATDKVEQFLPHLIRPWEEALQEIYQYDYTKQ